MGEKEKLALKEYIYQLRKLYPEKIEEIILFGSRARGDAQEDSDTDILVIVKNGDKELKNRITDLAFDVILKYGVDIEPVIFDSEEWAKLTRIPTSFTYCVLNEGKVL